MLRRGLSKKKLIIFWIWLDCNIKKTNILLFFLAVKVVSAERQSWAFKQAGLRLSHTLKGNIDESGHEEDKVLVIDDPCF